jgi:hypothetical protein
LVETWSWFCAQISQFWRVISELCQNGSVNSLLPKPIWQILKCMIVPMT